MATRNLDLERNAIGKFVAMRKKNPETAEDWASVHKMAYPSMSELPEDLKNATTLSYYAGTGSPGTVKAASDITIGGPLSLGNNTPPIVTSGPTSPTPAPLSPLQQLEGQMNTAKASSDSLANGNEALRVLQKAILEKTGVKNASIGESEIFKQAGVSGMGALNQSLAARSNEIQTNMVDFQNALTTMAGNYKDRANLALQNYQVAYKRYMDEVSRLTELDKEQRAYERELDLLRKGFENDKALALLKESPTSMSLERMIEEANTMLENDPSITSFDQAFNKIQSLAGIQPKDIETNSGPLRVAAGGSLDLTPLGDTGSVHTRGDIAAPECGQYTNDVAGTKFGNELSQKISLTDREIGRSKPVQVGDIVVTNEGGDTYGHVAIITGMTDEGYILSESNYKKKEINGKRIGVITHDRILPFDSVNIKGYVRPTQENLMKMVGRMKGVEEANYVEPAASKEDAMKKLGFGTAGLATGMGNIPWKPLEQPQDVQAEPEYDEDKLIFEEVPQGIMFEKETKGRDDSYKKYVGTGYARRGGLSRQEGYMEFIKNENKTPEIEESSGVRKKALKSALELLQDYEKVKIGIGPVAQRTLASPLNLYAKDMAAYRSKFEAFKSQLSLDNIKLLKGTGALSDREQEMLAKAASDGIDLTLDNEVFLERLKNHIVGLRGAIEYEKDGQFYVQYLSKGENSELTESVFDSKEARDAFIKAHKLNKIY